jgi:hypothetical protein
MKFSRELMSLEVTLIIFNLEASYTIKWRTFKLLLWMEKLHQSWWYHEILYADKSSKD